MRRSKVKTEAELKARRPLYSDSKLDGSLISHLYERSSEDFVEYRVGEILIPEFHQASFREISEQVRGNGAELLYRPSEGVGYLAVRNLQIVGRVWTVLWYLNQLMELEKELG